MERPVATADAEPKVVRMVGTPMAEYGNGPTATAAQLAGMTTWSCRSSMARPRNWNAVDMPHPPQLPLPGRSSGVPAGQWTPSRAARTDSLIPRPP